VLLSNRAQKMQASPIRKLIPYADQAKKRGIKVYHLNIGQPDIETPPVFFEYIKKYSNKIISYTNSAGLYELREKFAEYYSKYGAELSAEEIMITVGGSEAVTFAIAVVADPGDEIIVVEPFYANYNGFASLLNVNLVPVVSKAEKGYALPENKEFELKITPRTKGILFSNPSNPTGAVYSKQDILRILELARKYDLYVIVDEVYREFVFDGLKPFSVMEFKDHWDRIIMADSLSKRFSLCGGRIGTFVTKNKEILDMVMKMAQSRLSPPMISQIGSIGLLTLDERYFKEISEEYRKRRDVVFEEISKIEGVVCKKPKGAFYMSVKLPIDNSEKFVKWMLTDFNVNNSTTMVAPLTGFYATEGAGNDEIRIAYVLETDSLKRACNILRLGVQEYNKVREKESEVQETT